jgi:serine/threonine protein kinase
MLIYEMLHGVSPFDSCQSEEELKAKITTPINWDQLKGTLPSPLKRLILKCLKVKVEQRPSFSDLLTDEYIRKLYATDAPQKFSLKSTYTKKTADSEKEAEDTLGEGEGFEPPLSVLMQSEHLSMDERFNQLMANFERMKSEYEDEIKE